jgi:hypothetical protein
VARSQQPPTVEMPQALRGDSVYGEQAWLSGAISSKTRDGKTLYCLGRGAVFLNRVSSELLPGTQR